MLSLEKLTIADCENVIDCSGHKVFHVSSPQALMQAVGYLKHRADPWERIYMRGQSRLYDGLAPSLYRGISISQGRQHERIKKVIKEFHTCKLFKQVPDYAQEALLQHYGIKTTWIDIVDNIWIALWFAIHRAYTSGHNNQYMHFDFRTISENSEFAYIVLIRTEDSRKEKARKGIMIGSTTEVIDLRIAAPSIFLRPHAQHGLLFRLRAMKGGRQNDYKDAIVGIIRFSLQAGKEWLGIGQLHNTRALFPPTFYDKGYEFLLNVELSERSLGVITYIGV